MNPAHATVSTEPNQDTAQPVSGGPPVLAEHEMPPPEAVGASTRFLRRAVVALLLTVVLVPPSAAFYSYFSGVPLHLLAAQEKEEEREKAALAAAPRSIVLVPGRPHTVTVSEAAAESFGIKTGDHDSVAVAHTPDAMPPLVLFGSTRLDPKHVYRIKARFAPARVVEIAQVHDFSHAIGRSEFRELWSGDHVKQGDLLAVFYSVDVQNTKNDLLDNLVQLELDQKILDRIEKHREAVPEAFYLTQLRAVKGDRNSINRAITTLRLWDIPQDEIDALHEEAKKIAGGKSDWSKTAEGQWVLGKDQPKNHENGPGFEHDNPMGRVTLRAPFDGVITECNVTTGEMVIDNTVNLFQIADVSRLQVVAYCHEDMLPTVEALTGSQKQWTVRTAGVEQATGLPGIIDRVHYLVDPNMHTGVITGYVDNPGERLRGGQYVSATIDIPPPDGVVEIPATALNDDGRQAVVLVQPVADSREFTMRRVEVMQHFDKTVFVRSTPIPEQEQLTAEEAENRLLPKQPLLPGERVLVSGALEIKAAIVDLEQGHSHESGTPTEKTAAEAH
jgi:membrane fusion protein, heavy metal efflux system